MSLDIGPDSSDSDTEQDDFFSEDFGQKVDLATRIKQVLQNYPEGVSILKELLQNADDAGAKRVAFCLDSRQLPAESVAFDKLSAFQGPSVLAFNDAKFTERDFESIQKIGDSTKKMDAAQTGRFGVGFNAVYHLTDLPSFVSGSKLVMFDPHARYLPHVNPANPGKMLDFVAKKKSGQSVVDQYPDQFSGYMAFECDMQHVYNGTLFRLPLRTPRQARRSRISDLVLTPDKVLDLFNDFIAESELILLFLKHVEVIELHHKQSDDECELIFSICVSNASESLRQQRCQVVNLVKSRNGAKFSDAQTVLELEIESNGVDGKCTNKWLVSNLMRGSDGDPAEMASGNSAYACRLVPWGGAAVPINMSLVTGRAYCFLPLPLYTSLPVHVNGFFEISENRRTLWIGDDMSGEGAARAKWNRILLQDVVARAYGHLIASIAVGLVVSESYWQLFPPALSDPPWSWLTASLYEWMVQSDAARVLPCGNQWLSPSESVFFVDDVHHFADALAVDGVSIVMPPAAVSSLLHDAAERCGSKLVDATPSFVRDWFKKPIAHQALEVKEWVWGLLEYCLSDLDDGSYSELHGLRMIPLADGKLGLFTDGSASVDHLFVCSSIERSLLVPTVPGRVVDTDSPILADISSSTNVRRMTPSAFASLLDEVLPWSWHNVSEIEWRPGEDWAPGREWIRLFWQYIQHCDDRSSIDAALKTWPLIPTMNGTLVNADTALSRVVDGSVDESIRDILTLLDVRLLDHSACGDVSYVLPCSDGSSVVQAIHGSAVSLHSSSYEEQFGVLTLDQRRLLREYLSRHDWSEYSSEGRRMMSLLPLYEVHGPDFSSLDGLLLAPSDFYPSGVLTARFFRRVLSGDESLVLSLGVKLISSADVYADHILAHLSDIESADLRNEAMLHVLRNLRSLQEKRRDLEGQLRDLAFVPLSGSGDLVRPCDLYDPRKAVLRGVVDPDRSYPDGEFGDDVAVEALGMLGMRTELDHAAILQRAIFVTDRPSAQLLLEYIDDNADRLLLLDQDSSFVASLNDIKWMPVLSEAPEAGLPWMTRQDDLACPRDVRPLSNTWLLSFSYAILDGELKSKGMRQALGWESDLQPVHLVMQLLEIAKIWNAEFPTVQKSAARANAINDILQMLTLKATSSDFEEALQLLSLDESEWVLVGNRFVSPRLVAFASTISVSTEPFLYTLPGGRKNKHAPLFRAAGVVDEFGVTEFTGLLFRMQQHKDGSELSATELELCLAVLNAVVDHPDFRGVDMLIPDIDGVLAPAAALTYDDAPWLGAAAADLSPRFVHTRVPVGTAEKAGARSLRNMMLMLDNIPKHDLSCPTVKVLSEYLQDRSGDVIPSLLAELMEIADMSGASLCHVVLDMRTHSGQSVLHPSLAELQGPALCIYFDSPLSSEALSHLQMPKNSVHQLNDDEAEADGLEPGWRMVGDGLSGIYSVTDCPFVLAGELLMVFDPTGSYLSQQKIESSGQHWTGGRLFAFTRSDLSARFPDQFAPMRMFGFDGKHRFGGTLLRLPLRRTAGPLTSLVVEPDDIYKRLRGFCKTMVTSLIFLRRLQSMSVAQWCKGDQNPRLMKVVSIAAPASVATKRVELDSNTEWKKRTNFFGMLFGFTPLHATYQLDISIVEKTQQTRSWGERWLVTQLLGYGSTRSLALRDDLRALNVSPVVGAAACISGDGSEGTVHCHMLLDRVHTPLPIALHADFLLKDHRISVDIAEWTAALLMEAVPEVYANLIAEMCLAFPGGSDVICSHIPDLNAVRDWVEKEEELSDDEESPRTISPRVWLSMSCEMLRKVAERPVFFLPEGHGRGSYRRLKDGFLRDGPVPSAVERLCTLQRLPLLSPPAHVLFGLQSANIEVAKIMSPKSLRDALRKSTPSLDALGPDSFAEVLRYCVSDLIDGDDQEKWSELKGVKLCALADGNVAAFGSEEFLVVNFEQHVLFPGLGGRVVRTGLVEAVPSLGSDTALMMLSLRRLTPAVLAQYLPSLLPQAWAHSAFVTWQPSDSSDVGRRNSRHPSNAWMRAFWSFVDQELVDDVAQVKELFNRWPLIPLVGSELATVRHSDAVVMWPSSDEGAEIRSILLRSRVPIVDPSYSHHRCLPCPRVPSYSTCANRVLSALNELPVGTRSLHFDDLSRVERSELLEFFKTRWDGQRSFAFSPQECDALKSLPLFRIAVRDRRHSDVNNNDSPSWYTTMDEERFLCPAHAFYRPIGSRFLERPSDPTLYHLVLFLGAIELTDADVWARFLLPSWSKQSKDQQAAMLEYVRTRFSVLRENPEFVEAMSAVPFVPLGYERDDEVSGAGAREGAVRACPTDVLDPRSPILAGIFRGRTAFPCAPFDSSEWLEILVVLGMKTNISEPDLLLKCAERLDERQFHAMDEPTHAQQLVVLRRDGQNSPLSLPLSIEQSVCVIGRDIGCDIRIKLSGVSQKHAVVELKDGQVWLTRCDDAEESMLAYRPVTNEATLLNGKPVYKSVRLMPNDVISIAGRKIRYEGPDDKADDQKDSDYESDMEFEDTTKTRSSLSQDHALAAEILTQLWGPDFASLYTPGLCRRLAELQIVPVKDPIAGEPILVRYRDCALPQHRMLVFTVRPAMSEALTPPSIAFEHLKIAYKPRIDEVFAHIENLTASGSVDGWNSPYPLSAVFQSILKYLEDQWGQDIGPTLQERLESMNLVPVGDRFVSASMLFLELDSGLEPFMFAVPRQFSVCDRLFRLLGARETPEAADYSAALSRMARVFKPGPNGVSMNPNELRAAISICDHLVQCSTLPSDLVIPDAASRLTPISRTFFNDVPWLLARLNPHLVFVANAALGISLCRSLDCRPLSTAVMEELEPGFTPQVMPLSDVHDVWKTTISSIEFAEAVVRLSLSQQADQHSWGNLGMTPLRSVSGSATPIKAASRHNAAVLRDPQYVKAVLSGYRLVRVRSLRSRFVLADFSEDVTQTGHEEGSLSFVVPAPPSTGKVERSGVRRATRLLSRSHGVPRQSSSEGLSGDKGEILITELPPEVSLSLILARAVNSTLGYPLSDLHVLSTLCNAMPDRIPALLGALRVPLPVEGNDASGGERFRGEAGCVVVDVDRENVQLKPTRNFMTGEVIAYRDSDILRYGIVLQSSEDMADTETPVRSPIRRLEVLTSTQPRVSRTFLTSEVYSFRSAACDDIQDDLESTSTNQPVVISDLASMWHMAAAAVRDQVGESSEAPAPTPQPQPQSLPTPGVDDGEIVRAIAELLGRLDIPVSMEHRTLLEQHLQLQHAARSAKKEAEEAKIASNSIHDEMQRLRQSRQCSICLQCDVDRVIVPCGHSICHECVDKIPRSGYGWSSSQKCPFCRDPIQLVVNVYF